MNPLFRLRRQPLNALGALRRSGKGFLHPPLVTRPRLRWACVFAAVSAVLILAISGRDGGAQPENSNAEAIKTAPRTPRPTAKPTPALTPAATPAPTPEPVTPATEPPAPAPPEPEPDPEAASGTAPLPGTGPNYYVDDVNGNDANSGTSEAAPWRTLAKASSFTLSPGERLLFRRGGVWVGTLKIEESGTAALPVVIGPYGGGPAPVIQGANDCIVLFGSAIVVAQMQMQDCWSGVRITGGASFNRVQDSVLAGNVAGVLVSSGAS